MTNAIVLGSAIRNNLIAISNAQHIADRTSTRLATGKKVNSALDQPQNFFTASSLSHRASNLTNILDNIQLNIRSIEEALTGIESLKRLLNQAESIALESQHKLRAGEIDPAIETQTVTFNPEPLPSLIQNLSPVAYYRLNDAGNPAVNLGTAGAVLDANYNGGFTNGQPALYTNGGDVSTDFDGVNGRVAVPNSNLINAVRHPIRTIEVVFNADTTAGRQVLYEEGGNSNAINMYIDNGVIHFNIFDNGRFGPVNMTAPVTAGQTHHATLVFDGPSGQFRGYLDGANVGNVAVGPDIDPHVGAIGIGSLNGTSFMHDGPSPSNTFRFNGRISDVAIYNTVLTDAQIAEHANNMNATVTTQFIHRDFEKVMNQIDQIVQDSNFRGLGLLGGDDLRTDFNELKTNFLVTEGIDFTSKGLGIERFDFNDLNDLDLIIRSVKRATKEVREFGNSLVNDLGVIQTRLDFNKGIINNHLAAATELTIADLNEEGANQLAANTRLQVAQNTLSGAGESSASILQILTGIV